MTPSGTPALTKPMNSGTAEQEQNGVTDAEHRSQYIADALALSRKKDAGLLGGEKTAHDAHAKHDQREQHQHLRRVIREEADGLAQLASGLDR